MLRRSLLLLILAASQSLAVAQTSLRVLTHDSFELPAPLLAQFEREAGVKLQLIKGGDAGEMLNRLILTRARPIADLVFGIDNALLPRARQAGVIEAYGGPAAQRASAAALGDGVVPVDHGYVALNIDKAWFAQKGLALPRSLDDLAQPAYKDLLVVPHPATSSPGQAFLQATIAGLGEEGAFDWWARLRRNGLKVVKGWSEAYYTEFTRNGGARPIVVSYATSPAAEAATSKARFRIQSQVWSGSAPRLSIGTPSRSSSEARMAMYSSRSGTSLISRYSRLVSSRIWRSAFRKVAPTAPSTTR